MFFDRPDAGERALLVHLNIKYRKLEEDCDEFELLAKSAGVEAADILSASVNEPSPKYFIGSGKVDEIAGLVAKLEVDVVLFNCALSPTQERNLESVLKCRVIDRTSLILDIFAQRARTYEGKLQVELAQLAYHSTRLVRGWTHLERQKGGIGLRGPGETQLETDRRLLRVRIKSLTQRLDKVHRQRQQSRRARKRAALPSVSMVGYTNAGKSTLFNAMSGAHVYVADQLFATLDPTLRRIVLPKFGPLVLSDTVGFIQHLPHRLVQAFQGTLEESSEADLLLHVIDSASEERLANIDQVEQVLEEISAAQLPCIEVYNKIDMLDQLPRIDRNEAGIIERVWLSAKTGEGLELLAAAIAERLGGTLITVRIALPPPLAKLRATLYRQEWVESEDYLDNGDCALHLCLPEGDWTLLCQQERLEQYQF